MDEILIDGGYEEKGYNSCMSGMKEEENLDTGFKAWRTCLVSAVIHMMLFGILTCQGIHLVVIFTNLL